MFVKSIQKYFLNLENGEKIRNEVIYIYYNYVKYILKTKTKNKNKYREESSKILKSTKKKNEFCFQHNGNIGILRDFVTAE